LDDFGSGLSSFTYLKHLPVDGLPTIAEFVENRETLHAIRTLGIDYAQGHLISEPKPAEELLLRATEPA